MLRKLLFALASLILVTGCAEASVHVGGRGPGHLVKSTSGSFVGTPGLSGVSYDTSIGLSVDTNGRANLTPRAGATVFYVNSGANGITGSDSNTCLQAQSPATPKLNIQSAYSCVTDGAGDFILVAEGVSYTRGFGGVGAKGGFSAAYPLVMESYDATDPTNQAKWGTATGSNRPDINNQGADSTCCGFISGTPVKMYRAYRGLHFDGQAVAVAGMNVFSNGTSAPSYLLFENDDFDAVQLSVSGMGADSASTTQGVVAAYLTHLVVRSSTFHGAWATDGHGQGIYWSAVDGATFEDNAFIKAGWKDSAVRTDAANVGGPSMFAHPLYNQVDAINSIVRRNVFIDGPSDSGILKGGGIYIANLSIYNPFGAGVGNGNLYSIFQPYGVYGDVGRNAFVGDTWCVMTVDIRQNSGSLFHHNACAFADVLGGVGNGEGLMADDQADLTGPSSTENISLPTYPTFDHNVLWNWAGAADQATHQSSGSVGIVGDIHRTDTNNLWGASTVGSNTNNSGATFSNAYTQASLLSALGYGSLSAAETAWKAAPQLHGWRTGPTLMLAGYGVVDGGLVDLGTNMALTAGVPNSGQFIGTHDGTTLTFASLPTGVTGDDICKCWRNDGTGTVGSGTFSVTETPPTGPPHTTTIPWSISARPVLSSLAVTPSTTTASATISTNTGSGTLYWMVTTSATTADWPHIRAGVYQDHSVAGAPHNTQSISATGSQSIGSITGLSASTAYYLQVAQVDASGNPSLTSLSSFTTASSWTPASLGAALKAWYDPSDITTLFQNAAGTTAVTADGQSVCYIKDKSSNHFDLNNTTTANCPIYHTSGGKSWLAFNGTSMSLGTINAGGAISVVDGSGQHSAAVAVKFNTVSTLQSVLDQDSSPRVSQNIRINSGNAETIAFSSGGTPFVATGSAVSSATATVLEETTSTSAAKIYLNGGSAATASVTPPLQSSAANIAIGYNQSGPGAYFSGNLYEAVISSGVIGSTDLASENTWAAGKM